MCLLALERQNARQKEYADVETSSARYASRFSGPAGDWLLEVQASILRTLLAGRTEESILDVGGGHAQVANTLCPLGFKVSVLGSSAICRERLLPLLHGENCSFTAGDLLHTQYADCSFDVVTCLRLIPHCEEWPGLIRELCRVAKDTVIVDYPASVSLNALTPLLFRAKRALERQTTRPYKLFSHRQIAREFERNGYALSRRAGEFFLPMVLHRILKAPALSRVLELPPAILGLTKLLGSPVLVEMKRRT